MIENNEKFAFLRESVSKVPELDQSKKENYSAGAKRKIKEKEKKGTATDNASQELKRPKREAKQQTPKPTKKGKKKDSESLTPSESE